jgi:hypothetical protein
MRLYACFTVFDGLELLDKSIDHIMPFVDGVVICYQEISNRGNRSDQLSEHLKRYVNYSEVIMVKYLANMTLNAKENERRKHQLMIDKAKEQGATHYIMMATDHFYDNQQLFQAKRALDGTDIDVTFSKMYTYYKKPEWQLDPPEDYFMPFICRLHPHTRIEKLSSYPVLVDPSVKVNTCAKWIVYEPNEVMLHHYSMVRKDRDSIRGKFENAASPWHPNEIKLFVEEYDRYNLATNTGITYFKGRKIKVVDDFFGLNSIFK